MATGNNNPTRRRSSSHNAKPYDAKYSFVKKVTTRLSDLIPQRSWISKWINTSEDNEDALDNVENTEEIESEEEKPPPSRKPRIRMDVTHPPGTFSIQPRNKSSLNKQESPKTHYTEDNDVSEDFLEPAPAGPSGMGRLISSTPAVDPEVRNIATQRSELNSLVTASNNGIINGTDDNSESSESTSGCSSLIPQTNRQEAQNNASYSSPFSNKKRFMNDKLNFTNHLQSPRSLFLENSSRDSLSNRRPSFNASVMTNTLDRASPLSSPFYSGNTTFGGASAAGLYKRGRSLFNNSNELQLKVPKRTNVEVKPSSTTVDSSGMSQTAKKILEALEHFSSPISDAKKIPLKNLNNTLTPTESKKRKREDVPVPSARVGLRHATRELNVPTVADVLKLKRRLKLQDTTVAARKIVSARTEPAPPSQEYHLRTHADDDTKSHSGKLRAKGKVNIEEEETVETVNLPSIPLPISSLPNFNFAPPQSPINTNQKVPKKEEPFTFASPIKVSTVTKTLKSINNFTFSSPVRADAKPTTIDNNDATLKIPVVNFTMATVSSTITPAQNFIWSGSSTAPRPKEKGKQKETPTVPVAAACELKTGSVMDILGAKSSSTSGNSEEKSKSKDLAGCMKPINDTTTSTVWECSECLIKNDNSKTECFVCKAAKPMAKTENIPESKTGSANESKPAPNDCFGSQFKLSSNQWECTECCVRNKQSDMKCVACTAPKPGEKAEKVSNTIKPSTDLSSKIKPAEGTWECKSCKMKNSGNASSCSFCTTAKPEPFKFGSPVPSRGKESETANILPKLDTISQSAGFGDKFKANTAETWECPCCLVRNAATAESCPCCTTAKPTAGGGTVKKTQPLPVNGFGNKFNKPEGGFVWSTGTSQNDLKAGDNTTKSGTETTATATSSTASTSQFKFGIPAGTSPFKFGTDKTEQKTDSTSTANCFKFGSQTTETTQFKFGAQEEKKETKTETTTFTPPKSLGTGFVFTPTSQTATTEKSEVPKDIEKTEKKPCFTFGVPTSETTIKETTSAVTSVTPTVPSFTFNAPKPEVKESTVNKEKTTADVTGTSATQSTASTVSFPVLNTNVATTPTVQNNLQELKPTTGFQFGVTNVATTSNTSVTLTSTTSASLPSSVQSSFAFSNKTKPTQSTLPTFAQLSAPSPSTTLSSTFTLGESKPVEGAGNTLTKPTISLPSGPAKPLFPTASTATPLFGNAETKPTPTFSEENKPTAFSTTPNKPATFGMPENKVPTFGSTETKPSLFGTTETKIPVFGSNTEKPTPVFPTPTPQATPAVAAPAFGSSTATPSLFGTGAPVFQNNTASTFGTGTTPSIFPTTTKTNETNTGNSNLFTFGTTPAQPVAQPTPGFNFSENTNQPSVAQKPLFTFGSNANTLQTNLFGSGTFNNPAANNTGAFTFNAPKTETPAFGQSTVAPPIFGATDNNAQNQTTPSFTAPTSSTGFNFGQTAPTTSAGGFNFTAVGPNTTPTGGFNFNAPRTTTTGGFNFNPPKTTPTFDPNTPPSYNFTGGTAPPTFTAVPQSVSQRKIKKAIRRRN